MALSGSYNFGSTVTRNDIIDFALRKIGQKKRGMTTPAHEVSDAAFSLNLIIKQLKEKSDGAPSLKLWLRQRIRIFLEDDKDIYDTSDASDHIVNEDELTTTAMKVAGVATDLTIDVDSITGMASADVIGIALDSGAMHWTTINGTPAGDTVTITVALPSAVAIDRAVYVYTSNAQPPVNILTRQLRYVGGSETSIDEMDLNDYDEIADKSVKGTPAAIYYERRRTSGVFYTDVKADDDLQEFRLTVHYPINDLDASGDNIDFPDQWLRALGWLLGIDIAPEYGIPIDEGWRVNLTSAMTMAMGSDPETSDLFFEPDRID